MIYQTDKRLRLEARDNECYLFCVLSIHEEVGAHELTVAQISDIHRILVDQKYIRMDGWLNEKAVRGIGQITSGLTGKHVYMRQVPDGEAFTHLIAKFTRKDSKGKIWTHFVRVASDMQTVIYDPYDAAGSRTVRGGSIESYRFVYAEAI